MASDQLPFKKRTNPLGEAPSLGSIETIRESVRDEVEEVVVKVPEKKVEVAPKPAPVKATTTRPVKKVEVVEAGRDKYTATMEHGLRIDVKIAAAKRGLQFSQFIEEAVREKIEREGL